MADHRLGDKLTIEGCEFEIGHVPHNEGVYTLRKVPETPSLVRRLASAFHETYHQIFYGDKGNIPDLYKAHLSSEHLRSLEAMAHLAIEMLGEGKRGISAENLELLARRYRNGVPPCGGASGWGQLDEKSRQWWRDLLLSMLNAEVAAPAPDVDFVVSGEYGEEIVAFNKKAEARWAGTINAWRDNSCESRRAGIAAIYEDGYRILLDPKGEYNEGGGKV